MLASLILASASLVVEGSLNDPSAAQQWGWYRIKADQALDTGYEGAGVVVALLDTGIDTGHPDLAANIISGWNFIDNNSNVTDVDGHGTMVAGIVAAIANNSIGIAGVAPKVSIMPLKVLSESDGSLMDVNAAIRYAADHGAKIIGMSLGGSYSSFRKPWKTQLIMLTRGDVSWWQEQGMIIVVNRFILPIMIRSSLCRLSIKATRKLPSVITAAT